MARTSGKDLSEYTAAVSGGLLALRSKFGIHAGLPYYDPAGAAAGEDAFLSIDSTTGAPTLTLAT